MKSAHDPTAVAEISTLRSDPAADHAGNSQPTERPGPTARIRDGRDGRPDGIGAVLQTIMSTTGLIALILMAAHLLWALLVMVRIPYFSGMTASMVAARHPARAGER